MKSRRGMHSQSLCLMLLASGVRRGPGYISPLRTYTSAGILQVHDGAPAP